MGLSEQRYFNRLRLALYPEGAGLVEPLDKVATETGSGRQHSSLTDDERLRRAVTRGVFIGGSLGALSSAAINMATNKNFGRRAVILRSGATSLGGPTGVLIGAGVGGLIQHRRRSKPLDKVATETGSGRQHSFLTEDQPTLRSAAKGALIGGSIGSLVGTAFDLASNKKYSPVTTILRSSARSLGAPVGTMIGAGIGSIQQQRSGYKSTDEKVLRGSALAGAAAGIAHGLRISGAGNPKYTAILGSVGAAAATTTAATGMALYRALGRRRAGLPMELRPNAGPVGSVLGTAATGAALGKALATRVGVKQLVQAQATNNPASAERVAKLFSRRAWTEAGPMASTARRSAKAVAKATRANVRGNIAWHFRPLEQKGALIGAAAGAGLALGLLAAKSRRRKNQKIQDETIDARRTRLDAEDRNDSA